MQSGILIRWRAIGFPSEMKAVRPPIAISAGYRDAAGTRGHHGALVGEIARIEASLQLARSPPGHISDLHVRG